MFELYFETAAEEARLDLHSLHPGAVRPLPPQQRDEEAEVDTFMMAA